MKIYTARLIAVSGIIAIFLSCTHDKQFRGKKYSQLEEKAPGWIDGTSRDFSPDRYIVGVGVSSTGFNMAEKVDSSKNVARAEIAKIFKVKIESISEETLSTTLTGKGKYSTREMRETYNSFVRASTDMILEGVEIKDSYKGKGGEVYTLAVLEKSKARNLFQDKLERSLSGAQKQLGEAQTAAGQKKPLLAIKFYRRALLSGLEMELLNAQIVVADGKSRKIQASYSSKVIKTKINKLFSSVSIAIDGEKNPIRSHILEVLTALGFRVKTGKQTSDFLIKYYYNFYDDGSISLSGGYVNFKARSNLSLEFFKRGSEKVVGKTNLEARGVGKTADLAAKHAVRRLAETVREELGSAVFKFL